jgi:hypothetical protein
MQTSTVISGSGVKNGNIYQSLKYFRITKKTRNMQSMILIKVQINYLCSSFQPRKISYYQAG